MKTIRPNNNIFKPKPKPIITEPKQMGLIESVLSEPIEIIGEEKKDLFIEDENNVTFTVTLTRRQYNIYIEKGGVKWLKKAILGQKMKMKRKK